MARFFHVSKFEKNQQSSVFSARLRIPIRILLTLREDEFLGHMNLNCKMRNFRIDVQNSRDLLNNFKFSISNSCLGTTCTTHALYLKGTKQKGTEENKPCVFPFKHNGKTYYECIENDQKTFLWCKTSSEGLKWGKCGDTCRNHSSGIFF